MNSRANAPAPLHSAHAARSRSASDCVSLQKPCAGTQQFVTVLRADPVPRARTMFVLRLAKILRELQTYPSELCPASYRRWMACSGGPSTARFVPCRHRSFHRYRSDYFVVSDLVCVSWLATEPAALPRMARDEILVPCLMSHQTIDRSQLEDVQDAIEAVNFVRAFIPCRHL